MDTPLLIEYENATCQVMCRSNQRVTTFVADSKTHSCADRPKRNGLYQDLSPRSVFGLFFVAAILVSKLVLAVELLPNGAFPVENSKIQFSEQFVFWSDVGGEFEEHARAYSATIADINSRNARLNRSGTIPLEEDQEFVGQLATLNSAKTSSQLAELASAMLNQYSGAYEKGQILYKKSERTLLLGFADGPTSVGKALEYAIWPHQEMDLYRLLAQGILYRNDYQHGTPELAKARRLAAENYLKGLKVVTEIPDHNAELPIAYLPNVSERIMADTVEELEVKVAQRRELEKHIEAAKRFQSLFQKQWGWEGHITTQVVEAYTWEPLAIDELKSMVKRILGDHPSGADIVEQVLARVTEKLQNDVDRALTDSEHLVISDAKQGGNPRRQVEPVASEESIVLDSEEGEGIAHEYVKYATIFCLAMLLGISAIIKYRKRSKA